MKNRLLPENFNELVKNAIRIFWESRALGSKTQGGTRGNVIAGKNLDGFLTVVKSVAKYCGLPESSVFTKGRRDLTLPGYFRPTKNWDALIIQKQRLLAVLEFKSQVGSFGNNFNNRTEEALGNACDIWEAVRKGAFTKTYHENSIFFEAPTYSDPRPPFLGFLMVLEDCTGSRRPIGVQSPHFPVFPEFENTSYSSRYRILCEKLMEANLYKAAALVMSPQNEHGFSGEHLCLSEATSVKNLFTQLAGQLLADSQS